jgi:hypothetical protein
MKKKIALILIVILLIDLTSCHSYVYISNKQDYETFQDKNHVYVLDLITTSDSAIYFSSSFPGKLSNKEVKGPRHILLENFNSDSIHFNKNQIISYVIKDSIRYKVINRNDTILVYLLSDTTRIPFSEIKQMHIKKIDEGKTGALLFISAGALAVAIYLIITQMTFSLDMSM